MDETELSGSKSSRKRWPPGVTSYCCIQPQLTVVPNSVRVRTEARPEFNGGSSPHWHGHQLAGQPELEQLFPIAAPARLHAAVGCYLPRTIAGEKALHAPV